MEKLAGVPMIDPGFIISLIASIIALYGVYQFNQRRDCTGARVTWMITNPMFTFYFIGRIVGWWNGGLGDGMMAVYFAAMTASNLWGMFGKGR